MKFSISLNPIDNVVNISNNSRFNQYAELLYKCVKQGMKIKGFNIYYKNNQFKVDKISK